MKRIGRTIPPAAAPIPIKTILHALPNCFDRSELKNGNFERELKEYFNVKYCFLLSSGKAALLQILLALKERYPDRNEVLIPAFTCYSVPASIKRAGLKIKLCDLAPSSLDYDKVKLQKIVSDCGNRKKILCILVTHLFGCPADVMTIRKIVGPNIPIVEDAAQAMGEEVHKIKLGTIGDVGFFSLGRGKALSTMEGGVVITSRDDLGQKIDSLVESLMEYSTIEKIKLAIKTLLTNVMQKPSLFWLPKSLPFLRLGETIYEKSFPCYKISAFQHRLANEWKRRLTIHRIARKINMMFWLDSLGNSFKPLCPEKFHMGMIRLPFLARSHEQRESIIELSEQAGFGMMRGYPTSVNEIPEIKQEFVGQQFPQSKDICERIFSLPVHEFVSQNDINKLSVFLLQLDCQLMNLK